MCDATLTSLQRNNASSHTTGLTMGPDQPPTLPNDLYSWFQPPPPHTDEWTFQGGLPAERWLDSSYGTPMRQLSFQENYLPDLPRESYICPPLARPLSEWERGNCQLVSDILTPSQCRRMYNPPLMICPTFSRTTRSVSPLPCNNFSLQHGNTSHPLHPSEHPPFGHPLTLNPLPAAGASLVHCASLPQNSPDPHSQSQERIELGLSNSYVPMNASSGPPPQAATTSLLRGPLDGSESQANNLPAR